MANEIKIPCEFWPHPSRDANAYEDTLTATNNEYVQLGLILPNGVTSRICFRTSEPVPTNYGVTPVPKLWVLWKTANSDVVNSAAFSYEVDHFTPDTDAMDPNTWTLDSTTTDVSAGAFVDNKIEISLSSLTIAAGDIIAGTLARTDPDDLAADIQIVAIYFIAST